MLINKPLELYHTLTAQKVDSEEIEKFYSLKNMASILGSTSFKNSIQEKFSRLVNRQEIPESKVLALDAERVGYILNIEDACTIYLDSKTASTEWRTQGEQNKKLWELKESIVATLAQLKDSLTVEAVIDHYGLPTDIFDPSLDDLTNYLTTWKGNLDDIKKPSRGRPKGTKDAVTFIFVNSLYNTCLKASQKPTIINNEYYDGILHQLLSILKDSVEFQNLGSMDGIANDVIKHRRETPKNSLPCGKPNWL